MQIKPVRHTNVLLIRIAFPFKGEMHVVSHACWISRCAYQPRYTQKWTET